MLTQLTIENFGLIDRLTVDFTNGLNIFTGTTGAGKSIIIDALRIVLGERLKEAQIRQADQVCRIEGIFDLSTLPALRMSEVFVDFFSPDDPQLIIQRLFLPEGKHRIKLNGQSVTITQLKALGNQLMDFHGAYDHQLILSPQEHIHLLDRLVDSEKDFTAYETLFAEYRTLGDRRRQLETMNQSRDREMDMLGHQIKELSQVPLTQNDYDSCQSDQQRVQNAEKLFESTQAILTIFENPDYGLTDMIQKTFSPMRCLEQMDARAANLAEQLLRFQETGDQILDDLREYRDQLSFEPQEAQEKMRRYDIYEGLRRKYGPTIDEARAFLEGAQRKHNLLMDYDQHTTAIGDQIEKLRAQLQDLAKKLTAVRRKAASLLQKTMEKELKDLGIPHVTFEVRMTQGELRAKGQDEVVFFISPNMGEGLKPLSEIVSSGEAARVMLAMKRALMDADPIPTLIFDEIDAQIGGRLGQITGQKLKELSTARQVLLITHLPQIASFADRHFKVTKEAVAGRTYTRVLALKDDERIEELAQMMAGNAQSAISIKHAKDMLANARSY
jgi:DNA repair protein RecN (Recombination protein N)